MISRPWTCLDALVRKSLLIADRSSGRTRFSMLETIRRFRRRTTRSLTDRLTAARDAHARYFAGLESDVLALWDSPRQREAHDWFAARVAEPAHCLPMGRRSRRHRYCGRHRRLRCGAGYWLQQYEPSTWAEELIEPAKAAGHPKLAMLYLVAAQCYITGRTDDFVTYTAAAQEAIESGRSDDVPVVYHTILGGGYLATMPPEECVDCATPPRRAILG